jgi:hypothetical protein
MSQSTSSASQSLQQLYDLTEQIHEHLKNINENMDHNPPELVEQLQVLVISRDEVIEDLDNHFAKEKPNWTSLEQSKINQLREWEKSIMPKLTNLYHAFSNQMNKLQQGKQVAQRYQGGYGDIYTDGAYFDKRK